MKLVNTDEGFEIYWGRRLIIRHSKASPFLSIGSGCPSYDMSRGTFKIRDRVKKKLSPSDFIVNPNHDCSEIVCECRDISVVFREDGGSMRIFIKCDDNSINRLWISICSSRDEHMYGGGEQFTEFNLKGSRVRVWVSEHQSFKGLVSKVIRRKVGIKGDRIKNFEHYTTYYCCPIFVSSDKYFVHVDNTLYMEFDFRPAEHYWIYSHGIPRCITLVREESFEELLHKLTMVTGRNMNIPAWVYEGAILGIQGGTGTVMGKYKNAVDNGVHVSAIWCQDWEGSRITSFGRQLMWNWAWDEVLYPNLDAEIKNLMGRGVRLLGYINPFLAIEGGLYREASSKGYTVKNRDGKDYLVKITTFPAAMVDLTNPGAFEWIKYVIKTNMINFGLSGWMADFGEYLPADAVLWGGKSSADLHNVWPVLWARANREAAAEAGREDILVFMRSGFLESPKFAPVIWNGDQHVDWSPDYGMPSVIPAMLSLSMSGCGICHSDIGGYTTLPGITREKELFMRWAEMAAFTPVMRTHEGNRPGDNWQFDSDEETLKHFARMSGIYNSLAPYIMACVNLYRDRGMPVIRPLFMYYEEARCFTEKFEYLLGRDLLVSPVLAKGRSSWEVYLPDDNWVHLWTGNRYSGGNIQVSCPIGCPPVFYRECSVYWELFAKLAGSQHVICG